MPSQADPQGAKAAPLLPAALVCGLFALVGAVFVNLGRSWGWDESMHAELPAAQMLLALKAGSLREAVDVLLGCDQYPFVYPVALTLVQMFTGVSEFAARAFGRLIWGAGAFGIFLAAREVVRVAGWPAGGRARLAPYLALALALLSPLALSYSATLYAEVPFTTLAAFSLWAWLRRDGSASRELTAGLLVTLALFTRFNTGLMLGLGLGLDLMVDAGLAWRRGALAGFGRRLAWLAALPVLALAWWFILPWPGDLDLGAGHRRALAGFLAGNRGGGRYGWDTRLLHWAVAFAASPRLLLLTACALVSTISMARRPGLRTLWLVFLACGVPVWTHEFHLDRFLIPQGPAIWCLAGLGMARFAPGPRPALVCAAALALAVALPALDAHPLARALKKPETPQLEAYVMGVVDDWGSLWPGRTFETAGLNADEAAAILDLVAEAAGPDARVGWLGVSSELSPAAVHLGLLGRGGSPERFRRDAGLLRGDGQPDMCLNFLGEDPGLDAGALAAWADAFGVVITTRPVDLKQRASRGYMARYQDLLLGELGWRAESLGTVGVQRPLHGEQAVEVLACRRP